MIGPLFIAIEITLQEVWKEEEPEHGKHNKQFNQDDPP
jgi:hypothetical protein